MAFLDELDKRRRFDTIVTCTAILAGVVFSAFVVIYAFNFAQNERKQIYVLNGEVPITAEQTDMDVTLGIEAKSHVVRFHDLFFNLAPDEAYIQYNIEKSMYLIDETGLAQYNTLKERGFYSNILSTSAIVNIMVDSIRFNQDEMSFTYYGRQRIERKSSILYRAIVTKGNIRKTARTDNNPHGLMITDYRTVRNEDLEYKTKSAF